MTVIVIGLTTCEALPSVAGIFSIEHGDPLKSCTATGSALMCHAWAASRAAARPVAQALLGGRHKRVGTRIRGYSGSLLQSRALFPSREFRSRCTIPF